MVTFYHRRVRYEKKKNKKRNFFVIIFIVAVFCISFGYSLLSKNLTITGNSEVKQNTWDIHFDNIQIKEGSIVATKAPIADANKLAIDFSLTLNEPGDFYEFTADIRNDGSIDAMIDSIIKTPTLTAEQLNFLNYTIEYQNGEQIVSKQILPKYSYVGIKVRVEYRKDITEYDLPSSALTLNLSLVVNYLQSDGNGTFVKDSGLVPTIEQLQAKHTFMYYSSINDAVTDINNGTVGTLANATSTTGVAGVYVDNGHKYVVLLKDYTSSARIKPSTDMTINLGGHVFIANDKVGIDIVGGNVTIDGRLPGSTILMTHTGTNNAKTVQVQAGAGFTSNILGGTYISDAENATGGSIAVYSGTLNISNAKVVSNTIGGSAKGISVSSDATCNIESCEIIATSQTGKIWVTQFSSNSTGNIKNSYLKGQINSGDSALGAYLDGNINVENSKINVFNGGTLSTGIETGNIARLSIDTSTILILATGGKGYGVVIREGANATVNNSQIRAYANYLLDPSNPSTWISLSQGMSNNGTLTINNTYVHGTHSGMAARGTTYVNGGTFESYGHGGIYFSGTNSTTYVRNATIREAEMPSGFTATDASIRIDNDTHTLYLGVGNNFTASNTTRPSRVITTTDTYIHN